MPSQVSGGGGGLAAPAGGGSGPGGGGDGDGGGGGRGRSSLSGGGGGRGAPGGGDDAVKHSPHDRGHWWRITAGAAVQSRPSHCLHGSAPWPWTS